MGVWDDIDFSDFNGEDEENEKLKKLLSRSHNQLVGNYMRKLASTGKTHSEETRAKLSKLKKGIVFSKEHKENLKNKKLINKITAEQILELQKECNTANEVAEKLGMTWWTYKRIATELGVYKKLTLAERNQSNGNDVLVWKYDKNAKDGKGEFIGEYPSQSSAMNALDIKGSIKPVLDGKYKQMKGYYFEFKK